MQQTRAWLILCGGFFLLATGVASASNIACSAAAISDASYQAGTPPGCTQGNLQFSFVEQVVNLVVDTADSTSGFSDNSVVVIGAGAPLGTAASSQKQEFFQIGADFLGSNTGGALNEEFEVTFTIGVTDLSGSDSITGVYLAVNTLALSNGATVQNISESFCTGTTVFSSCGSTASITDNLGAGTFTHDTAVAASSTAAAQFTLDILLPATGDGFDLKSFYMGFDESAVAPTVPEPSTFIPAGMALAGISLVILRRKRA